MRKLVLTLMVSSLFGMSGEQLYSSLGCYGCHGIDAKGGNGFPPLANKPKEYLVSRLQQYKKGAINSNKAQMMIPYAKNLTSKEIEALASYLSTLTSSQSQYYEEYDLSDAM